MSDDGLIIVRCTLATFDHPRERCAGAFEVSA
jgi:hypothetical protein